MQRKYRPGIQMSSDDIQEYENAFKSIEETIEESKNEPERNKSKSDTDQEMPFLWK